MGEIQDPYDLPSPDSSDRWPPGRPEYVIVVDQLRGWQPGGPPSLAELLETGRTREPEPDLEAEHDPHPKDTAMTLTINDTTMTSDQTGHTARQAPGRQHDWEVSWLPGQVLDRNTAITAMILADTVAEEDLHEGNRLWPHVQGWAAELGLTGPDAIARASQQPHDIDRHQEQASGPPDREAAD